MNLQELLGKLRELDEDLESEINFEELLGNIQDKVDNIKYVLDRLEIHEMWLAKEKEQVEKRLAKIRSNKRNLLNFVNFSLTSTQAQQAPGHKWIIKIQNNPKQLEIKEEASRDLWKEYDKYIRRNVTYAWDKDALKTDLKEEKIPERLAQKINWIQGTHVRFYARKD